MSAIAQKLCEEIVDPVVKSSSRIPSTHSKTSSKRSSIASNRSKYCGRPTHSVVIKKEREINKIVPHGSNRTVINKFKSKETVFKKSFVDIGVNTVVTGPLRCDNDSITVVRKRDKCCSGSGTTRCKCSKRPSLKGTPKLIQTDYIKSYKLMDKACTQCVETASFGTVTPSCFKSKTTVQKPIIKEPRLSFKESNYKLIEPRKHFDKPQQSFQEPEIFVDEYSSLSKERQRNRLEQYGSYNNTTYRACKRWALSQYPVRGPDF